MIQRQAVPADTEDGLRNAKELRHAMSTLELQQLSVENKVQKMLEMVTQVWDAGARFWGKRVEVRVRTGARVEPWLG